MGRACFPVGSAFKYVFKVADTRFQALPSGGPRIPYKVLLVGCFGSDSKSSGNSGLLEK